MTKFTVGHANIGDLTGRKSETPGDRAKAVAAYLNKLSSEGLELVAVLGTSELLLVFKVHEPASKTDEDEPTQPHRESSR